MKITRITVSVIVALNIASAARAQETFEGRSRCDRQGI